MDGTVAIERNRVALQRIVVSLVAIAGPACRSFLLRGVRRPPERPLETSAGPQSTPDVSHQLPGNGDEQATPTLPRHLWRAVLRLLRPAETAARRLIIAAARGIVMPPPPSPRRGAPATPPASAHAQRDGRGGLAPFPRPRTLTLPLFDRLRRVGPHPVAPRDLPRICVPGWTRRLPVPVRHEPAPDDPVNAARLALRLDALARALDDLPGQARRFARWQAASARAAAGTQDMNLAGARTARFRRVSPLRSGPPPGGRLARYDPMHRGTAAHAQPRGRGIREIDEILAHAHELAIDALERPDTS